VLCLLLLSRMLLLCRTNKQVQRLQALQQLLQLLPWRLLCAASLKVLCLSTEQDRALLPTMNDYDSQV
jgi:hypothetical protein